MKTATKFSKLIFELTVGEFKAHDDEHGGFCLACGAEAFGVEPDARKYTCEDCGAPKVYGAAELLIMNRIQIVDEVQT